MAGVRILCDDIATSPGGETVPVSGSILAGIKTEGEETSQYNSVSSCDSSGYPSIKLETKDNLCETGAVSSDNCNSPAIKVDPLKLEPEEMLSGTGNNEPEAYLETPGNISACSDTVMSGYNSDIDIKEEWDREADITEEGDEDLPEHVASPTPCTAIQSDSTRELSQPKGEKPVPNTPSMGSSHRPCVEDISDMLDDSDLSDLGVDSDENNEKEDDHLMDDAVDEIQVFMDPPYEVPHADTDCDSDNSDDPEASTQHLPGRVLRGKGTVQYKKRHKIRRMLMMQNETSEEQMAETASSDWSKTDPGLLGSKVSEFEKAENQEVQETLRDCKTAYDFYKLFQRDEFVSTIVEQSKLYSSQKSIEAQDYITTDNLRCVEAFLLHSGYNSLPQRKLLWQREADTHSSFIERAIRRSTAEGILQCLHFANNLEMNKDKFFKIRPIFDNINSTSQKYFGDHEYYSVDESMIPYYGRNSSKQLIRGKPVRFGFKVWSLCASTGEGVHFEPYCGKHTNVEDLGLGQGPNVVLSLIEHANLRPGSKLFFGNLFSTFPLLTELSKKGIAGTGTVRQDKLSKIPIYDKKSMQKKNVKRGFTDQAFREDQVCVGWKDSKPVYMASNFYSPAVSKTCRRYDRQEKKYVQVPIPDLITNYNKFIGGVDILEGGVARYRVPYRKKKWWFPFYSWSLSICALQAWRLRMKCTGQKEPQLSFLRELVREMMATHGQPPAYGPRPNLTYCRFDQKNHWIATLEKGKRKTCVQCTIEGKNSYKSSYICEKCEVGLHIFCFKKYHVP